MNNFYSLASYASHASLSKGRLIQENECNLRSPYQRDRDRIVHSTAFRRLEYKTQVFVNHEGDHYRTRLTHSLEVSNIARSIARTLHVEEDLTEALALSHDLGHPPFGHAGEETLNEAMRPYGGFNHNAHSFKILTLLENKYANFEGLNLTYEVLEGLIKHNGPINITNIDSAFSSVFAFNQKWNLDLTRYSSMEAQIAAIADDIAYNNHDFEDGIRSGSFTLEMLETIPIIQEMSDGIRNKHPVLSLSKHTHELKRRLTHYMIQDIVTQAQKIIKENGLSHIDDIRNYNAPCILFSFELEEQHKKLKAFLMKNMYLHFKVNRMKSKAKRVIGDLFHFYFNEPQCLPPEWNVKITDNNSCAEQVCNFIAGMTDRFALEDHRKLFL